MEKANYEVPTYDLSLVKALLQSRGTCVVTRSAFIGAVECGYQSEQEIIREVCSLLPEEFYKSMPSKLHNGETWQDVYKVKRKHPLRPDALQDLYIKVQINAISKAVVISFKISDS